MSTRKIIDPKQNGKKVWLKGHAQAIYMSNGETVEDAINNSVNEEDLAGILDRISENEKVTSSALNELRENLNNINIPIATMDTIGGIKLGTLLDTNSIMVRLAGDNAGNVGININHSDLLTGIRGLEIRKSYFNGHDENQVYDIAPLSFGTVRENWNVTNLGVPVDSNYFTLNEQGLTIKLLDKSTVNEPENFIPVSYGYGPSSNSGLGVLLSDDFTVSTYDGHFRLGLSNAISSHGYEEVTFGSSVISTTINPNIYYIWKDEMSNLTVSLGPTVSGVTNEYSFQFTSGSTPTVLTLPSNIKWADGKYPEIEANCTYQISILNNLGVCIKFC